MTPEAVVILIFSFFFPGYAILRYVHPAKFGKYDPILRFLLSVAISLSLFSILGLTLGNHQVHFYRNYIVLPILVAITVIFLILSFLKRPEEAGKIKTGTLKSRLDEIGRRRE